MTSFLPFTDIRKGGHTHLMWILHFTCMFLLFCENNSLLYKECFQIRQFNIFCKVGGCLANMNLLSHKNFTYFNSNDCISYNFIKFKQNCFKCEYSHWMHIGSFPLLFCEWQISDVIKGPVLPPASRLVNRMCPYKIFCKTCLRENNFWFY